MGCYLFWYNFYHVTIILFLGLYFLKKKQNVKAWTGHKKIWLVTASVSLDEAPHGCRLQSPYLGKEFVLNAPEKAFQSAGYNILILIYK